MGPCTPNDHLGLELNYDEINYDNSLQHITTETFTVGLPKTYMEKYSYLNSLVWLSIMMLYSLSHNITSLSDAGDFALVLVFLLCLLHLLSQSIGLCFLPYHCFGDSCFVSTTHAVTTVHKTYQFGNRWDKEGG